MRILGLPEKEGKYCYEVQYDEEEPEVIELDEKLPEWELRILTKKVLKIEPVKREFKILGHKPDGNILQALFQMGVIYYFSLISSDLVRLFWIVIGMPMFGFWLHDLLERIKEIKSKKEEEASL